MKVLHDDFTKIDRVINFLKGRFLFLSLIEICQKQLDHISEYDLDLQKRMKKSIEAFTNRLNENVELYYIHEAILKSLEADDRELIETRFIKNTSIDKAYKMLGYTSRNDFINKEIEILKVIQTVLTEYSKA